MTSPPYPPLSRSTPVFQTGTRDPTTNETNYSAQFPVFQFADYLPGAAEVAAAKTPNDLAKATAHQNNLLAATKPPTFVWPQHANRASFEFYANNVLANPYRNLDLNDCVIACMAHAQGVIDGNAALAEPTPYTDAQILTAYSNLCGGSPTHDLGCNTKYCMDQWITNGFTGNNDKIYGYLQLSQNNTDHIQTAISLFDVVLCALNLDVSWENQWTGLPNFVWDLPRVSNNPAFPFTAPTFGIGHCVTAFGYDTTGKGPSQFLVNSWGVNGFMTFRTFPIYVSGGIYAPLSAGIINRGTKKSPLGYSWTQLVNDLVGLGGVT